MAFPTKFRLAIAQITSNDVISENLSLVEKLYREAGSADLVVFPENTLSFRIRQGDRLQAVEISGPEIERVRTIVDEVGVPLMLTTALSENNTKAANATIFFCRGQEPEVVYRKIHLFDVDVEGAPPVRESDHFEFGEKPKLIELNGWKIGLSICYDLRFAELYWNYAQSADLILVPAAFLVPTGQAHWQVLLRARAIENQCYVAAPAQSGKHVSGDQVRMTYGHSLVVDPWGVVIEEMEASPAVRIVELEREKIATVRKQIPMGNHRRLLKEKARSL